MVTYCKRKSKTSFIVLCVVLLLSMIIQPKQSFANENEVNQTSEMINTLDNYINAEDNQFEISKIPNNVYFKFGKENIDSILNGVKELNTLAQDGEVIITDNETVYDTNDTSFDVQGGVNKVVYKWYGRVRYFSTASAKEFVYQCYKVAAGSAAVGAVAAFLSAGTTAIFSGLTGAYFTNLALDVDRRNSGHNRGIILHVTWAQVYWTQNNRGEQMEKTPAIIVLLLNIIIFILIFKRIKNYKLKFTAKKFVLGFLITVLTINTIIFFIS
ncbi:hypothetical protein [Gottfriedia acidiceleris]|uniref:hypothetical protein n=1 Tax=Gottfriedia acidiceleris TaxID=371036 RepID=UPI00300005DE